MTINTGTAKNKPTKFLSLNSKFLRWADIDDIRSKKYLKSASLGAIGLGSLSCLISFSIGICLVIVGLLILAEF